MESCVYEGWVRHRRLRPVEHAFRYRVFMMYLDLAELDEVFDGRWLWSTRRFAPARFRRSDYVGDPSVPLDETIRELVAEAVGQRPRGPIRLLTNLRYFGHCFNPVSFYYCFEDDGTTVSHVVAEVTNTPWGERHCYVMTTDELRDRDDILCYRFDKTFHVSPFMAMDIAYDWRFRVPGQRLIVHNDSHENGGKIFDATLSLRRRRISGPALAALLVRYPLQTIRIVWLIHWQAARLWLRRVPFVPHPRHVQMTTDR